MKKRNYIIFMLVFGVIITTQSFALFGLGKKKEENVVLRFSWWGSAVRHEATLKVINRYMELNPNVKIEAEYSGWDGYYQKTSTQIVGGVASDIMQLDQPWLAEMSKGDAFLNLEDYSDYIDLSGFNKQFLEQNGKYNNKLVALPTGFNGYVFLYNKKLLEKYDIKNDMTWEDFIKIGVAVNKEDKNKYLLLGGSNSIEGSVLRRVIIQNTGKNLVNDSYARDFSKEEAMKMFSIVDEIYSKNITPSFVNTLPYDNNMIEYPQFVNGNILGSFTLLSNISTVKSFLPDVEWGAVSLPTIKNAVDTGTWTRASQVIGISKLTKYPKEAVKFLNYFYNDEEAIKILGTTRSIPSSKRAIEVLERENTLDATTSQAANVLVEKSGLSQNRPEFESTLAALDVEFLNSIALGKLTPEKASEDFIEYYDAELKKLKKRGN